MLPINPNQSIQPSLASYLPQLASAFSNTAARPHPTNRVYETAGSVMQINYGLINIPAVGSHNEITVNYHSTGSDAQLLREILRPLQSIALQPNTAPLASLGVQKLQQRYLEGLKKDSEIKDALAMYVALECTSMTGIKERFSLEEKVNDFLASKEKKVLLLLGEAGSGKSTFNRYLARSLWEAYDKKSDKSDQTPIPLFIPLSSLKEPNANLISEYLKKEKFTEEQIADLKENYRFIFILDGYDEIKDRTRLFYVENELDQWQAKVIVTSRPEYLGVRYERQFHPKGQAYILQTYQLAPFSDLTIKEYVNKYKKTSSELEKSIVEHGGILEKSEVKELVRNPFLLKIALSELPALAEKYKGSSQHITRLALYDQFVEGWFERSQDRLSGIRLTDKEQEAFDLLNKDFAKYGAEFSKDFAVALYQTGLPHVTYLAQPSWKKNSTQDWCEKFLNNHNAETKLLRFNAPLICRDGQYQFIHKSIQDYFVARGLWEELRGGAESEQIEPSKKLSVIRNLRPVWDVQGESLELERSSFFNELNVVRDPAVLSFLVEQVQEDKSLLKSLLDWVKASKTQVGVERGSSNALTTLVKAGVPFIGWDLSEIKVRGADLSFGVFDSAQLQRTDLTGAKLHNIWLREANLSGAQMAGVEFGELPYLQEESSVRSCAYSPDGKNCAVGLANREISVYSTSNWGKVHTLEGHTKVVNSVVYSPSGTQIASGSEDCTVRLWDAESGALVHTLEGHTDWVNSLVYSPSGSQLASGSDDCTVRLWDVGSGALMHTLEEHTDCVRSVVYSPCGSQLASGSWDETVRLWDTESAALMHTLEGHNWAVNSVVYSPSGSQIASGSRDATVRLWDAESGALVHTLKGHIESINSVVYSPSGSELASGSDDRTVRLWDAESGALVHTIEGHTDDVNSVVYSPSGSQIASGSDDKVRLWEVERGALVHTLEGHTDWVNSVVYSPSGSQIASGSSDKTVRLWDAESGALVHTLKGYTYRGGSSVVYSPSGSQIASGGRDATVRLWDAESGALVHTLEGHTDDVNSMVYSPSGSQLASGSRDKTVRLWDAESGALVHTLEGHNWAVNSVVYSPSGSELASGSDDRTVRLWDAESGALVHTLEGHTDDINSVVYSPSGSQIASGSKDCTVRLWEVERGALVHTLEGHTDWVNSVVYSPSGSQIASGSRDKTVRLWDAESGALEHNLEGHTGIITGVVYSPSGSQLASGSWDKTVRLWDTQTGQCQMLIQDCGTALSLAWKEASGRSYVGIGSDDKSVRQWEVKREGEEYKAVLCWSTMHGGLTVGGTFIEGVQGLNAINKRLLRQRGAVGELFSCSRNAI